MKKVYTHYMGSIMCKPNVYAPQANTFSPFFRLFFSARPLCLDGGVIWAHLCLKGGSRGTSHHLPMIPSIIKKPHRFV